MTVEHVEEHLNCFNYSRSGGPVEVLEPRRGTALIKEVTGTEILCIITGKVKISTQKVKNTIIDAGNIILLSPGAYVSIQILNNSYLLSFNITKPIQLCDICPLESLTPDIPLYESDDVTVLPFNLHTQKYFDGFVSCLNEGLKCFNYLEIKSQEFMFILRAFYTRSVLAKFFRPLITTDTGFSDFILKNYRSIKTVEELARMSNYSRSGFKAHFRKTFGTSASNWLREKKARNVYHELNASSKTLQEISDEYNFSSVSHMSIFCKEYFGMPPGKIRRDNGKKSTQSKIQARQRRSVAQPVINEANESD